jgi:hypothetical protein
LPTLFGALLLASLAGCKERTFNSPAPEAESKSAANATHTGNEPGAARIEALRAGLAFILPPARDENGVASLPSLGEVGFTAARFASLLSTALGETPTQKELDTGDVFNSETPTGERTLTNESCLRTLDAWRLTHLQILPYERLVPGSYAAVAQAEADLGKRLVAPLVFRGTFQPWCVSRKTPSRLQVFVLEQALQVEWRVLDLTPARQVLLVKQLNDTLASPSRVSLNALATAFETPERASAREQVLGDIETLTATWHRTLSLEKRTSALAPLTGLFRKASQAGFGFRAAPSIAPAFVHPGFLSSPSFAASLRVFLTSYATNANLNIVFTSLSESLRAPVFSVVTFDGEQARHRPLQTKQTLRTPSLANAPSLLTVRTFLDLGRFTSANETAHSIEFDANDALNRQAFDRVDVEPHSLKNLPVSETTKLRARLQDVNGIHKSTTNCAYCHQLGGGRVLSGHMESEGPQMSALTLARAASDAPALLREFDALRGSSLDSRGETK